MRWSKWQSKEIFRCFGVCILLFGLFLSGCTSNQATSKQETINQTGFPIVNTPITLSVFGCQDPNQADWKKVLVLNEYAQKTNINMDYQLTPQQGCSEKRNLVFGSNNLPDIFLRSYLTSDDIAQYGMQDKMLIPLEGLIDKFAPNIKKIFDQYPEVKAAFTAPDGHIYAIGPVNSANSERTSFKPFYNKIWFSKLHLTPPTTPEELEADLKAIRDANPSGRGQTIPLGLRDMNAVYTALAGSWGLGQQLGYKININNDKVHIWLPDPKFKSLLMFLHSLYTQKLLWPGFYENDVTKWRSNLATGNMGIFFMPYTDPFYSIQDNYEGMAPIKGPFGDQMVASTQPMATLSGGFAISKVNKNPEASIRWLDYFYGEEGSLFFNYGDEGKTYTMKDGKPVMNDSILNDKRGLMTAMGEINLVPGGGFPLLVTEKYGSVVDNDKIKEVEKFIDPYLPKVVYPSPIFDEATAHKVLPIKADIDKYVDESVTKFIIGDISFDKWDEYTATLQKMHLQDVEQAYQQAYDRMKKTMS